MFFLIIVITFNLVKILLFLIVSIINVCFINTYSQGSIFFFLFFSLLFFFLFFQALSKVLVVFLELKKEFQG